MPASCCTASYSRQSEAMHELLSSECAREVMHDLPAVNLEFGWISPVHQTTEPHPSHSQH